MERLIIIIIGATRYLGLLILFLYIVVSFFYSSLFQTGDEIFSNGGRIKLIICCAFLAFIYIIKLLYKKYKLKNLDKQYIRDIPNQYSVPVIAFLYNKRIKIESVMMTVVIKLYELNLITISKQNGQIIYKANNFENNDKISESERYILEYLLDNEKQKYSYKQFLEVIISELHEKGLITPKKTKVPILSLLFFAMLAILQINGYISRDFYDYILFFGGIIAVIYIIISVYTVKIIDDYSLKGLKEHYNMLGFYNFLNEFSILSKRDMKEYALWKEYLQFAILFGINKNYDLDCELKILTTEEWLDFFDGSKY